MEKTTHRQAIYNSRLKPKSSQQVKTPRSQALEKVQPSSPQEVPPAAWFQSQNPKP
jgi:hypothetical protein